MKNTKSSEQLSKPEIERRFTAALGRALVTPRKPHAPLNKQAKKATKKPSR